MPEFYTENYKTLSETFNKILMNGGVAIPY